ncbi:MAG TPA: addiction module protein [Candidatus Paceibacterota bacterium]|nr:addiction module protein [Candidatus Paceibacterota bacterium]
MKQIEEQAKALIAEEPAKLAEAMLESLRTPVSEIEAAWTEEIERRVAAFDRGEIPAYRPRMCLRKLVACHGETRALYCGSSA